MLSCNDRDRNYGNSFIVEVFVFLRIFIRYFYVVEVSIVLNAIEQND